jgi:hypothetical protein
VRQADHGWWRVAGALGLIEERTMGGLAANLRARKLAQDVSQAG